MKHLSLLVFVSLLIVFAACTSTPAQQPTSLQVVRIGTTSKSLPTRTWNITDTKAVQQLFQDIRNLPAHHNNGTDSCSESFYIYHLNFFTGTTSIEKDDLGAYCGTLATADGSYYDPTPTFNAHFSKMLGLTSNNT